MVRERDQALCIPVMLSHRGKNKRKDGSFRRLLAKNIVAKLVLRTNACLLVSYGPLARNISVFAAPRGRAVCTYKLW